MYEWDETKRKANLAKHGLDFIDADLVLESPYVMVKDSPRKGETRKQAFAYVFDARCVLAVAYLAGAERCRIVSFRPANKSEREAYHEWLEDDFNDQ